MMNSQKNRVRELKQKNKLRKDKFTKKVEFIDPSKLDDLTKEINKKV